MRTRIKFCGMTRAQDVACANALGVDAIGLVFAPASKRRIDLARALELRAAAGPLMHIVALFMDNEPAEVRAIVSTLKPGLLQFHGEETRADCERLGLPYLKAVPMSSAADLHGMLARHPNAAGFVLDSHAPGGTGGTGQAFDWNVVPRDFPRPLLLAGGLTPDNVAEAVRRVHPHAVDVSSGIEAAPGTKDEHKMRCFVDEVRRADLSE